MQNDIRTRARRPYAATRRAAVGGTVAAALLSLAETRRPAAAKKKKQGCSFTTDTIAKTMTLTKSCTTTKSVQVPGGFTLDGGGFTITGKGNGKGIRGGIVVALNGQATIQHLTVDGSLLTPVKGSTAGIDGIAFFGNGNTLSATAIQGVGNNGNAIRADSAGLAISHCTASEGYSGLFVGGGAVTGTNFVVSQTTFGVGVQDGGSLDLNGGAIDPVTQTGASAYGNGTSLTLDNVSVGGPPVVAVAVTNGATATIKNSTITTGNNGVTVDSSSQTPSTATITANTITLAAPVYGPSTGVHYGSTGGGSIGGNQISGFHDTSGGNRGYGIWAVPGSTVTIGSNTFPSPPGNDKNVLDERES